MFFKFDPNSTKNEGRYRLRDKRDFSSGSYIRKNFDNGIGYVLGKLKNPDKGEDDEKLYVQAIRFKKNKWTEYDAAKWWNKHGDKFNRPWKDEDWAKETPTKIPREEALKVAKSLARKLKIKYLNPDKVTLDTKFIKDRIIPAGSARRGKEMLGDLDLIVTKKIHKRELENMRGIDILSGGDTNTKLIYCGIKIDLFVLLDPKTWGAGLLHYTGSLFYNTRLRAMVKKPKWTDIHGDGWMLSQKGLTKNGKAITTYTERELQQYLGVTERLPKDRK